MRRQGFTVLALLVAGATLAGQSAPRERALFDGKTTAGWRGFKKPAFPARGWVVQDGWLKHLAAKGEDSAGAGDIIEYRPPNGGPNVRVTFTKETVPHVDLAAKRVVIDPPAPEPVGK